jgi:hypothetical protein
MTNPETILKPKWCFDFYFGTKSNPTNIRSGCVGADNKEEAERMIRAACVEEHHDLSLRLRIKPTRFTWPHIVS